MTTKWTLREMNPADLKNHPVNSEIYGTPPIDDDMLSSVKDLGVLEPIRATKDNMVLSGHRRRQHAIAAKLKTIPVLVARHAISDAEQVIEVVESNRAREKTMEQKAREFTRLAEAKAEIARKRQAATHIKVGKTPEPAVGEKVSAPGNGRAKDQAAAEVGLSRPTAEKAAEVVEVIDEKMAAADEKGADELRTMLNEGTVAAAHRAATHDVEKDGEDGLLDGMDGPVPPNLRSVFAAVTTFRGLVQKIGKLQNEIEELQRSDAGAALPINELCRMLPEIQAAVKFATPYCECPKCRRTVNDSCKSCKGLGWVTKSIFSSSRTTEDEQWLRNRS